MAARPKLVKPTKHRFNKRSDAQAQLAWSQASEGRLDEALKTIGKATVSDDLACLGLALSLATQDTVGLALWGAIVREASGRNTLCAATLSRVEKWDGKRQFRMEDFPELTALATK